MFQQRWICLARDFIHPEHRYPVIATTSKLLTTGVDVKTCKLIVLDQRISRHRGEGPGGRTFEVALDFPMLCARTNPMLA